MPTSAFLSYSHADERRLERLRKHLAMLQREGSLQAWSDHAIIPGDNVGRTIDAALETSGLFLALVSPDYLASQYCYEREFQRALERQSQGRMRIVAVILEPCDWLNSPFSQGLVLPKDGKPVSEWTNENSAYLNVVGGIRRALVFPTVATDLGDPTDAPVERARAPAQARRLKVRQHFDAIQRADYAEKAFQIIQGYFREACGELHEASDQIRARFEPMSAQAFTCTVVNRALIRRGEAHITVRLNKGKLKIGDISYLYQRHADDSSANGWMSVEADDYNLYLAANLDHLRSNQEKVTPEQAAESLWNSFIAQAGIEYEG